MNWQDFPNFERHEFDSPDAPGSGDNMRYEFMERLQRLRTRCRFPFTINSGFRTPEHNRSVGGEPNSAHLRGWAADIHCMSSAERYKIIEGAYAMGFQRIGIYPTFIHLDLDPERPSPVMWTR